MATYLDLHEKALLLVLFANRSFFSLVFDGNYRVEAGQCSNIDVVVSYTAVITRRMTPRDLERFVG